MIFIKTEAGQLAFRQRSDIFTPRQRSAYILFDGKRSVQEVLRSTGAMGVTAEDIRALADNGMLAPAVGRAGGDMDDSAAAAAIPASATPASADASAVPPTAAVNPSTLSTQDRYRAAYPLALQLTAALGLRGFRLNLAVEGAGSYEQMVELAPRILDAVGPEKFEPLRQALEY